MRTEYYVDAENVGILWTKLEIAFTEQDKIYILANKDSQRVSKRFIETCPAKIETMVFNAKGHNDLDILIAGMIGASIAEDKRFVIISNDTGYNSFIDYFLEHYSCDIERIKIPEEFTRIGKLKHKIISMPMDKSEKQKIAVLLDRYQYDRRAKFQIHSSLCKNYGNVRGLELYNMIRKYM